MIDDDKTGTTNWLKSHLAAIGSAAVLSVYAAGYVRTKAAAARVAEETPRRRPVARAPIAPAEIAQHPSPRPDSASGPAADAAVTEVATPAALAAHDSANAGASRAGSTKHESSTTRVASADRAKPAEAHASTAAATTAATTAATVPSQPAPVDTTPARVPASTPAPAPPSAAPADTATHAGYKDGVYSGWGTSRHGDIEATVDIKGGRIVSATITQCLTRYSCSWISALPPQVVDRQSAEVDYVSGATESSNAFYGAVAQALGKAK